MEFSKKCRSGHFDVKALKWIAINCNFSSFQITRFDKHVNNNFDYSNVLLSFLVMLLEGGWNKHRWSPVNVTMSQFYAVCNNYIKFWDALGNIWYIDDACTSFKWMTWQFWRRFCLSFLLLLVFSFRKFEMKEALPQHKQTPVAIYARKSTKN